MAGSEYYNHTTYPPNSSAGSSSAMRAELDAIETGFGKLPTLVGTASMIVAVNSAATALEAITTTGTGNGVRATSPTLVTPVLGTPASGTLTNCTGLPLTTGVTGTLAVTNGGTGVTTSTGSGANVLSTSPTLVTPVLGTPASGTLTNCTGLPISTGVSGLAAGVATFLATPSSANLKTAVTDETGSGALVFANTPTLVTPVIGAATGTSLAVTGAITSSGATSGVGYASGAGGTVTQATSKTTNVTLNTICGEITLNASALAADTTATFTFINSNILAGDMVILNHDSGGMAGGYTLNARSKAVGGCFIDVRNVSTGTLSEVIIIGFAVIKGALS